MHAISSDLRDCLFVLHRKPHAIPIIPDGNDTETGELGAEIIYDRYVYTESLKTSAVYGLLFVIRYVLVLWGKKENILEILLVFRLF